MCTAVVAGESRRAPVIPKLVLWGLSASGNIEVGDRSHGGLCVGQNYVENRTAVAGTSGTRRGLACKKHGGGGGRVSSALRPE